MGMVFCLARMEGKWSRVRFAVNCPSPLPYYLVPLVLGEALRGAPRSSSEQCGAAFSLPAPLRVGVQWFGCPASFLPLSHLVLALCCSVTLLASVSSPSEHPQHSEGCPTGQAAEQSGHSSLGRGRLCVPTGWGLRVFVFLCWSLFCFLVYVRLFIILTLTFVLQLPSLVKRSFLPGTAQGRHWS